MWGGYKGRPVVDPHHPTPRDSSIHYAIVKSVLCYGLHGGYQRRWAGPGSCEALLEMATIPGHTMALVASVMT